MWTSKIDQTCDYWLIIYLCMDRIVYSTSAWCPFLRLPRASGCLWGSVSTKPVANRILCILQLWNSHNLSNGSCWCFEYSKVARGVSLNEAALEMSKLLKFQSIFLGDTSLKLLHPAPIFSLAGCHGLGLPASIPQRWLTDVKVPGASQCITLAPI